MSAQRYDDVSFDVSGADYAALVVAAEERMGELAAGYAFGFDLDIKPHVVLESGPIVLWQASVSGWIGRQHGELASGESASGEGER